MEEFNKKLFLKWLSFLRENPDKQIVGRFADEDEGTCCAIGALRLMSEAEQWYCAAIADSLLEHLGLRWINVADWNDYDRLTFPEIADKLEAIAKEKELHNENA